MMMFDIIKHDTELTVKLHFLYYSQDYFIKNYEFYKKITVSSIIFTLCSYNQYEENYEK